MPLCASSPHHITAVFVPVTGPTTERTGSIGVGLAVEPRLTICHGVRGGSELPRTTAQLLESEGLTPGDFTAFMPLPWRVGYAVSGASAVSAALLAASLKGRGIYAEMARAHEVEVDNRTGLGDVLAISCGVGLVIRRSAGAPGVGSVECLFMPRSLGLIGVDAGTMSTPDFLSGLGDSYFGAAKKLIDSLISEPSVDNFLTSIRQLTDSLGLLDSLLGVRADAVRRTPYLISYYVKKKVTVIVVERQGLDDAVEHLLTELKPLNVRLLEPSARGPYIWRPETVSWKA